MTIEQEQSMRFRTVMSFMTLALAATAVLSAQARQTPPQAKAAAATEHNLAVTIKYTGKGVIDATHPVLVFLFETAEISAAAHPVNMEIVTANGGVASFARLPQEKVSIVAVYDPSGAYKGQGGPPPIGTPMGYYNPAPRATAAALVTLTAKTAVTLTFDGSAKFKG